MRWPVRVVSVAVVWAGFATGCPVAEGVRCNGDADCKDGKSCAEGTCVIADPPACTPSTEVVGDGADQDCDGFDACYADGDRDGVGGDAVIDSTDLACGGAGLTATSGDCDDADADRFPGHAEVGGDGVDQDCDGTDVCFRDGDDDTFGGVAEPTAAIGCSDPYVAIGGDCDDATASVNPSAAELVADGADQDCDGVDACYQDGDGDGFGVNVIVDARSLTCTSADGGADDTADCDDGAGAVFPGATEVAGNARDDNCDAIEVCFVDADFDGVGAAGTVESADILCDDVGLSVSADDCDDAVNTISPNAAEEVANGVDEDCDLVDACYADNDGDGHAGGTTVDDTDLDCSNSSSPTAATVTDCNDAEAAIGPFAVELVADGVDQDCDGDELCFADADGDGFGEEGTTTTVPGLDCDVPGAASNDRDCSLGPANVEGSACDDGDPCTLGDVCSYAIGCSGFSDTCSCDGTCGTCGSGCCAQTCAGSACPTCSGCRCELACSNATCDSTCDNGAVCDVAGGTNGAAAFECDASTCRYDTQSNGGTQLDCDNALCLVNMEANGAIDVLCTTSTCTGGLDGGGGVDGACTETSVCDLTFDSNSSKVLFCDVTSQCLLTCVGGGVCDLQCPGGTLTTCSPNVRACNTACP